MSFSPPETRESLILRLRDAADVAAWEEVMALYGPLVFRLAVRKGLQVADADDVVQEVFAAVAQSVGKWLERTDKGRFRAWLLAITRNIAINALTRGPRGGAGVGGMEALQALAEMPCSSDSNSSQFDLEYRQEVYRWAAAQVRLVVAPSTWEAFQITHVDGVSIDEAANRLKVSVGKIYLARSRVMSRLRELARQFEVSGNA